MKEANMLAKNESIKQGATEGCFSMDLSSNAYHAEKGYLGTSGIKLLLQSPAHFKHYQRSESPDMVTGTALHMILLEPEKFLDTYAVYDGDKRGKQYTEFVEANTNKIIIKQDVMDKLSGMRNSVLSYPKLDMERVLREGKKEHSVFWEDPETGVGLKARADCLTGNVIFDLKKTLDCRPFKFIRRCVDLRYDIQSAHYKEGYRRFLGEDVRFMFIAIEDAAPYGVWVHESSPTMEAKGEMDARRAINLYARCQKEDRWPLYEEPYSEIDWPEWASIR